MAPAAHRAEVDVPEEPPWTAQHAPGDSPTGDSDGDRESELGYTRIQGALKNVGHRVARSTIATMLKKQGIPPSGERPTSWQTFLRAHWGALVAADFFTTEVWTLRGLITYYTLFVIELHSRRVRIVGSTPHPDEALMLQIARHLTDAADGVLREQRFLICDRDRKGSTAVRHLLEASGVRVIRTPFRAPNCKGYASYCTSSA